MSKKNSPIVFVCANCGAEYSRWAGRCSACGEWNTLRKMEMAIGESGKRIERAEPVTLKSIKKLDLSRIRSGIDEFDLVLGGGIVPGSVMLLGGQPGVGKSTLVWQVACEMRGKVVYIAGEESPAQMRLRAERIGKNFDDIIIFEDQNILAWLDQLEAIKPDLLIIDSIQTIYDSQSSGSPGSILQVKHCALKIISMAKKLSLSTIIIGHVTKEGEVAGPKMLEHLVDAVFYLEGEKEMSERFLRSQKNRFGPTEEMGVFRLTENGLISTADFGRLSPEVELPVGLARTGVVEGSRVYFIEVQALVQKVPYGFPKRNAVGYDLNRLQMTIAILSRHTKVDLGSYDVFVNISDAYKLKDPIGDLAIISALSSSFDNKAIAGNKLILGEVDLAGRIHLPESAKAIIKTAKKIGYQVPAVLNQDLKEVLNKFLSVRPTTDVG